MNNWILKNRQQCLSVPPFLSTNYWTPLANQVVELDPPEWIHTIRHTTSHKRHVQFTLPHNHINRDSTTYWQRRPLLGDNTIMHPKYREKLLTHDKCRIGVLNGSIPSAISDTGATSHALLPSAPSIPTGICSTVVFHLPNGTMAPVTTINKLHHNVREPARSANIVPTLSTNSRIHHCL